MRYQAELAQTGLEVAAYNTGHKQLDEFRRSILGTTLCFIQRTLKTNLFVPEKHALAFRLDPAGGTSRPTCRRSGRSG